MGRVHQPTEQSRAFVVEKTKAGVAQERLAKAMGISVDTMAKYYRDELDSAMGTFELDLEESLGQRALNPRPEYNAVAIFMGKVRLGYRETVAIDPAKEKPAEELTDDELRARIAARAKQLRADPAGPGGHDRGRRAAGGEG